MSWKYCNLLMYQTNVQMFKYFVCGKIIDDNYFYPVRLMCDILTIKNQNSSH